MAVAVPRCWMLSSLEDRRVRSWPEYTHRLGEAWPQPQNKSTLLTKKCLNLTPIATLQARTAPVRALAFSASGRVLASGGVVGQRLFSGQFAGSALIRATL